MDIIDHIIEQISEFGYDVAVKCDQANGLYKEAHDIFIVYSIDCGRRYKCHCIEEAYEIIHKMRADNREIERYDDRNRDVYARERAMREGRERYYSDCDNDRYSERERFRRDGFDIVPHREYFRWDKGSLKDVHATKLMYLLIALQEAEAKLCKRG